MTKTVLDHVAIGTRALADGWNLFGGLLGGSWVYGGDSPGFWWGQLEFLAGPKIELITPTGGPDASFLERFLTARHAGPHHLNFIVPDIGAALSRLRAAGLEPVQVSLASATWKEAFLHPRDAFGIVIQIAEQAGPPPWLAPPAGLPAAGPRSAFVLVEQHVTDLAGALRLFAEVLEGEVVGQPDLAEATAAELTWGNGARLRLVRAAGASRGLAPRVGLGQLRFARGEHEFSAADRARMAELAGRLGVSLKLGE